jgi:hypothetical protein
MLRQKEVVQIIIIIDPLIQEVEESLAEVEVEEFLVEEVEAQ